MKVGHPSSIQGMKDNHNESSEEEHSEEAIKEVKKPRLGESRASREKDNDINILEEGNVPEDKTDHYEELLEGEGRYTREKETNTNFMEEDNVADDNTDHSEELAEEKVGDKDHNKDLKEGDKISEGF